MAADDLPDLDALALELVQLKHRHADELRLHDRLLERGMAFPSDLTTAKIEKSAAELESLNQRIEAIEAQLLPLRRHME